MRVFPSPNVMCIVVFKLMSSAHLSVFYHKLIPSFSHHFQVLRHHRLLQSPGDVHGEITVR